MKCYFLISLKKIFFDSFFSLSFLLEDNCFTIRCWPLLHISMNQPQVYICPLPPEQPSHSPPNPTPLGCHRALGWVPCVFPLAIYFIYGNVYVSMLFPQLEPSSPSSMCPHLFSMSVSRLLLNSSYDLFQTCCGCMWCRKDELVFDEIVWETTGIQTRRLLCFKISWSVWYVNAQWKRYRGVWLGGRVICQEAFNKRLPVCCFASVRNPLALIDSWISRN